MVVERLYLGFWPPLRAKPHINGVFECPEVVYGGSMPPERPKRYPALTWAVAGFSRIPRSGTLGQVTLLNALRRVLLGGGTVGIWWDRRSGGTVGFWWEVGP